MQRYVTPTASVFIAALVAGPPAHAAPSPSVSCGRPNRGALARAAELPAVGPAHEMPGPWRKRSYRYGTTELVGLILRAAATVAAKHPGARLGVADLSAMQGGPLPLHRSHQSGRDVDLLFYARDDAHEVVAPEGLMPAFRKDGRATMSRRPVWRDTIPPRIFDTARNWALVRALLEDPHARVMHLFVSWGIRRRLLTYARAKREPPDLVRRAAVALKRPRASRTHNDHMHVRIACPRGDRMAGKCRNDPQPTTRRRWRVRCPAKRAGSAAPSK